MYNFRYFFKNFALFFGSIVPLASCTSIPTTSLTDAQVLEMHQSIIEALNPMNRAANKDWLSGSVLLSVTINNDNQLLGCSAAPTSGASGLVAVAERACWATVFPPLPVNVFRSDGKIVLRMPMIFTMPPSTDPQQRASYEGIIFPAFSQGQYFWENGISEVINPGVGQARFDYVANAQGRVLSCSVGIGPIKSRKKEFQYTPQLVQRLETVCLRMNILKMPGLAVGKNGLATGTVWTSYAPWRQKAPKMVDY